MATAISIFVRTCQDDVAGRLAERIASLVFLSWCIKFEPSAWAKASVRCNLSLGIIIPAAAASA